MRAGRMRAVVSFEAERRVDDGQGGAEPGKWQVLLQCRGEYIPERGREQIAAGHLEGSNLATLRVRYSASLVAYLNTQARAVIDGVPHQIRSIIDPDQRQRMLELVVEKGVAPHT